MEANRLWIICKEFMELRVVCLIIRGVKMSKGSEHKHVFELSEQDGWVDPSDEFVDDQSWKIDKCL